MDKKSLEHSIKVFKRILDSSDGFVIDCFLRFVCGFDEDVFPENESQSAFFLGRRSVYLKIKKILNGGVKNG